MNDIRTPQEKERHRKIGQRAEEVASWYFRLNGFLSLPGFVVHLDQDKADVGKDGVSRYQRTEADFIGVRFVDSKEIINSFENKRAMIDDLKLTNLCQVSNTKQALFVLVEVKAGLCMMNGPWTNRNKQNMQRVIRRLGFAINEEQIELIADKMYTSGRYEDDFYVLQYICIGGDKNPEISHRYSSVVQIDWIEIGNFLIERFKSFPEKTPDGQVHDQWPKFGREFGKWISLKIRSENPFNVSPTVIQRYIKTGELH
jgi:hypothetical protein